MAANYTLIFALFVAFAYLAAGAAGGNVGQQSASVSIKDTIDSLKTVFTGCAPLTLPNGLINCTRTVKKVVQVLDCTKKVPVGSKATLKCLTRFSPKEKYKFVTCSSPRKWNKPVITCTETPTTTPTTTLSTESTTESTTEATTDSTAASDDTTVLADDTSSLDSTNSDTTTAVTVTTPLPAVTTPTTLSVTPTSATSSGATITTVPAAAIATTTSPANNSSVTTALTSSPSSTTTTTTATINATTTAAAGATTTPTTTTTPATSTAPATTPATTTTPPTTTTLATTTTPATTTTTLATTTTTLATTTTTLATTTTTLATTTPYAVDAEPYTTVGTFGRYKAYNTAQSWNNAEAKCIADGGHLFISNSAAEADAVIAFGKQQLLAEWIWMGYTDKASEGTWLTVKGGAMSMAMFTLTWLAGNPDTYYGDQDCVVGSMYSKSLDDIRCDIYYYNYICEQL